MSEPFPTSTQTRGWHRVLLLVGSIGPLGYLPASGTASVLVAGIPLTWLMRTYFSLGAYLAVCVAFTTAAVWVHDVGDRLLGEKDSRKLVLDELAGFFIAATLIPWTWPWVVLAFVLERGLDIVKVPPANVIENRCPGGIGVVGDDLVAGAYTLLALYVLEHIGPVASLLGPA